MASSAMSMPFLAILAWLVHISSCDRAFTLSPEGNGNVRDHVLKVVAASVHDEIHALGTGFCVDNGGRRHPENDGDSFWTPVQVEQDGSSAECAVRCLLVDGCSGYMTKESSWCATLTDSGFRPSSSDNSTVRAQCFWRHKFTRNTSNAYSNPQPIPKIIWSFWTNPKEKQLMHDHWFDSWPKRLADRIVNDGARLVNRLIGSEANKSNVTLAQQGQARHSSSSVPEHLPPFVHVSIMSWVKLNPDHQLHVLNENTMWDWLDRADLPHAFDQLVAQHKSDAIRLALLVKYGGVWLDASIIMLKPVDQILGNDPNVRTFFTTDHRLEHVPSERRVDGRHYVENFFLAAPPSDPFLKQAQTCFNTFFATEGFALSIFGQRDLGSSGLFSNRQLEEMEALGMNSYFVMYACVLKVLDEDAALWHWWESPQVRHLDAKRGAFRLFQDGWASSVWYTPLVEETNPTLLASLEAEDSYILKFPETERSAMDGLSERQLIEGPSTLQAILSNIGVGPPTAPGTKALAGSVPLARGWQKRLSVSMHGAGFSLPVAGAAALVVVVLLILWAAVSYRSQASSKDFTKPASPEHQFYTRTRVPQASGGSTVRE